MGEKQVIAPPSKWSFVDLREVYRYRQLLSSLALRDIKVRYAQTAIGLLWAVITPLISITILTFVFQKVGKIGTDGVPPMLFAICGYGAWSYFASLISGAGNSILESQDMVQKIYFPRLVLPLSKSLSGLVEFSIVMMVIATFMIYHGVLPTSNVIYLPLFVLLIIAAGISGGIWLSALTIRYRDFRFVAPFLLQLGLFVTPIAYPSTSVPQQLESIFYLNPLVGIIEGFRWSLLNTPLQLMPVGYSIVIIVLLLVSGLMYFAKVEKVMSDLI